MFANMIDNTRYMHLMRAIKAEIITFDEYIALHSVDKRYLCVRHDIDEPIIIDPPEERLDAAIEMARLEYINGIRSTYFLLHTADYFDYSQKFIDNCKIIQDYGHNLGFHNDALYEHLRTGQSIKEIVRAPLDFLRHNGIEIYGTSGHGRRENYEQSFLNYEIWQEFDPKKNEGLLTKQIKNKPSLKDFGLNFETYFLNYTAYLSEAGMGIKTYKWYGMLVKGLKLFDKGMKTSPKDVGKQVINQFNKLPKGMLHLNIHPNRFKWVYAKDKKEFKKLKTKVDREKRANYQRRLALRRKP